MKLHQHGYSPAALDQMVTVNAHVKSAQVAVKVIKKLTPLSISPSHLLELTATIGEELAEARDQQTAQFEHGKLPPSVEQTAQTVAVGTDGGRILTRAEDAGRGVHQPAWKETKVACLTTLDSQESEVDPHPQLPGCFADAAGVGKLVRQIKSIRSTSGDEVDASHDDESNKGASADAGASSSLLEALVLPPEATAEDADEAPAAVPTPAERSQPQHESGPKSKKQRDKKSPKKKKDWRPKRRVRTSVSSLCNSDEFGPKVAAEARRRGFFQAARRAFLGDGLGWNWTLQARYFPTFEPILDFIHPITYVYEASRVVAADEDAAWSLCERWLEACWQGRVSAVLWDLRIWQTSHPLPAGELPETDGRVIVSKVVTYLSNNASRMDYPKYRRLGLPVTSSMVESLIKEINYRVKGTEKSWLRPSGCESILQVRNAVLCDDADRLSDFILSRPGCAFYRPSTARRASQETATAA